jgi:hypothetical protein
VIGSGERVSMQVAIHDQERYHVDIANRTIWDRAYWEILHGETVMPEAQAA